MKIKAQKLGFDFLESIIDGDGCTSSVEQRRLSSHVGCSIRFAGKSVILKVKWKGGETFCQNNSDCTESCKINGSVKECLWVDRWSKGKEKKIVENQLRWEFCLSIDDPTTACTSSERKNLRGHKFISFTSLCLYSWTSTIYRLLFVHIPCPTKNLSRPQSIWLEF